MSSITSFTDYFKEERDIYVQNISPYNVVVNFDIGSGQMMSHTFTPTRDPVNLTMHVPFKAIANSSDFRKMISRRPPVIKLITHDEYMVYYTRQATSQGLKNANEAIDAAADRYARRFDTPTESTNTANDEPAPAAPERKRDANGMYLSEDEVINPRVLNLCLQVHPNVPENQKMTAQDMLSELEVLSSSLKFDDWEYVVAHGYYKSVKKYAKQMKDSLAPAIDDEEDEKPAKKPKKATKQPAPVKEG